MPGTHTTAALLRDPIKILAGTLPVTGNARLLSPPIKSLKDVNWGGFYKITGTLKVDDTPTDIPVHRLLILLVEPMMIRVSAVWSDAVTGAYEFNNIRGDYRYTVLGMDYQHDYRGVVADNLIPDPM